jgi:REP element-mobilizing transposase RayT
LPGDPRGFRNSHHRIHSGGDYKNRPPKGEHEKLHEYFEKVATPEVTIPVTLREYIGMEMLRNLKKHDNRCLALAVGKTHAHLLVECGNTWDTVKKLASRIKQTSSRAVGSRLPGVIWSRGGSYNVVKDKEHHTKVYHYILNHGRKENAWTWNFRV